MVTFDEVLPALLRVCEGSEVIASVERWCFVRDLRGRVRLVLEPKATGFGDTQRQALEDALLKALAGYFAPPIWTTHDPRECGRLAREVLSRAQRLDDPPPYADPATGEAVIPTGQWLSLERRLSKTEWLERGAPKPPWGLDQPMPAIVTFYSFKGGVGRTTALAACAWQLAAAGRRVAVIDLDLEAPGLGTLLQVETERGVLDFIVDHLACGSNDLHQMSASPQILGAEAPRVQVFPSSRLDERYLDKLARLDFAATTDEAPSQAPSSPAGAALRNLIGAIGRQTPRPDFILLDSRAGLHDLAGLSLHGLAHVDVLFSRADEQGYRGLELAVATLARQRPVTELRPILVHAVAPAKGTPEAQKEEEEFLARAYEIVRRRVYALSTVAESELPPRESSVDIHSPKVLRFDDDLLRFSSLSDRRALLFGEDYVALRERVEELCEQEAMEAEE